MIEEIVFQCRKHGDRTEDQVYRSNDKSTRRGFRYKCKECTYAASMKRPCKVHGDIKSEDRLSSGQCKICSLTYFKNSNQIRDSNREEFNEKQRLKREANPELAALEYKFKYQKSLIIKGRDILNDGNKARKFGLSIEDYQTMFLVQDNKCAICKRPETRIFKDRITKEMKIAKLCLDHDHTTGKLRQLLCHDCNTSLGKFKDDIQILQSAIDYLKKHKDKPDGITCS